MLQTGASSASHCHVCVRLMSSSPPKGSFESNPYVKADLAEVGPIARRKTRGKIHLNRVSGMDDFVSQAYSKEKWRIEHIQLGR